MAGLDQKMSFRIRFNTNILLKPEDYEKAKEILEPLVIEKESFMKSPSLLIFRIKEIDPEDKMHFIRDYLEFCYWPLEDISDDMVVVSFDPVNQEKIKESVKQFNFLDYSGGYNLHDPETGVIIKTLDSKLEWLKQDPGMRFNKKRLAEVPEGTTPEKFIYGFGL